MRFRGLGYWWIGAAAVVAMTLIMSSTAQAQSSSGSSIAGGVAVDADGVLRTKTFTDPTGQLMRERINAAKAALDPKVTAFSKLRKVSLNRLEQAILDHRKHPDRRDALSGRLAASPLRVLLSRKQGHRAWPVRPKAG